MSKEEKRKILQKYGIEQLEKDDNFFNDILRAMDEYAKQEAIGFAEWVMENYWIREPFPRKDTGKTMWAIYGEGKEPDELKTTKQLLNLYLQSKSKP